MFIQMGSYFVNLNRVEAICIVDGWLRIRTFSGYEYMKQIENGKAEVTLANLLTKLVELQGGTNEDIPEAG